MANTFAVSTLALCTLFLSLTLAARQPTQSAVAGGYVARADLPTIIPISSTIIATPTSASPSLPTTTTNSYAAPPDTHPLSSVPKTTASDGNNIATTSAPQTSETSGLDKPTLLTDDISRHPIYTKDTTTLQPTPPAKIQPNPKANQTDASYAVHPLLIYSIRYEIRGYDLFNFHSRSSSAPDSLSAPIGSTLMHHNQGSKHSKTLIAGLKNTIGLDFYYSPEESYIFWTDVIEERIYRGTINNGTVTNVDPVVQTGLATAEGLAVDWIGHNIYWVESTQDHIEVSNMNGSYRRTLVAGDMENPRAIAVDPRYGYLFWTDWDKKRPRIERATMSGEDRKTLVHIKEVGTSGGWPNGLTLDYDSLKIYWIDANSDSIHAVDYDGNNHQQLLKNFKSLCHPFSVTLFENNLYWTDWKTNSVSMVNKQDGSDAKELQRLTNRLFDIKVFHPSRQPRIENSLNPCFISNGNCSHLCLLSTNHTRKCECPHLMKLGSDNETCEVDENILLIGRMNEIRAVDINKPLYLIMAPITVPKVFNPRQFEFDAKSRSIFWADSQTNEVKRAQLSGTNIETIIDVIIESPSGLALDWISGNIYVTSVSQNKSWGKIFISNLYGEYISILMDHTQALVAPKSIAVHPMLGLLFCVDEDENSDPIIFMARMDGRRKNIFTSRLTNMKLENPTSLAMDYELNRVYWINQASNSSHSASIQYYDILGDKVVTFLDESEEPQAARINPSVLCVDGDDLIVGGRSPTDVIMRMSQHNPAKVEVLQTQSIDQLSALRVYNASTQVGKNACSNKNGNCSQLCVPINSTSSTCKCTMGYTINPSNQTECIGKNLFIIFSYNLGMKGIGIDRDSQPEDYYLPPIHRAFRASSIDYVHRDNLIYWVDNEEGSITRINRDTTNYQIVVQGLESEESIGIDWVAGNIYWLDPYYDVIEVARLNGSSRYVIQSGDMDKANGIVVNPIKGYIVWSDTGTNPKIETAQLDGSKRRVIVSANLTHIDDLAIDYAEDYIYWVDSSIGLIERVRQDGTGRQIVYNATSAQGSQHNHLVSIAIHNENLYIADSVQNQGSIIVCDKNDASNRQFVQQHLGDGIRDMSIFAEQPIPSADDNPCVANNGGCQDLCMFTGQRGKRRCICSHGKLAEDGMTCEPYDKFVMFSRLTQIDSLHIKDEESFNNSPYQPITIENKSSIISLTIDYNAQRVIYSEINRDQICSVLFNGTDRRVLVEKQSLVEGITFSRDQLYWTSIYDNSISRLNTTSSGVLKKNCDSASSCSVAQVEKIVKLTSDDKPRGIAVDSCTGYVYWTNWNVHASIQRASPHNGYKIESIIKTNIRVPNGIAIDQKRRKLYWCDARLDKIEVSDMDGTNRHILISAAPQHPFALAIWEDYVFWTDWIARGVFKADKYTGTQAVQVKKIAQRPMGIAVAAPDILECPIDLCEANNGGCPTGFSCIMHNSGVSGGGYIECQPQTSLSHDVILPKHRCKHSNSTQCYSSSYLDIIMDSMDRYNLTELEPIETRPGGRSSTIGTLEVPGEPISSVINQNVSQSQARNASSEQSPTTPNASPPAIIIQKSALADQIQRPVGGGSNNISSGSVTPKQQHVQPQTPARPVDLRGSSTNEMASNPIGPKSAPPPSTPASAAAKPAQPPVSANTTSTPPISISRASTLPATASSSLTETSQPTISTTVRPNNVEPSTNSSRLSTPPPCQIVPAALSPSTSTATSLPTDSSSECKTASQFKCYLSESLLCISGEQRCDGHHDCPSKEDENDCYLSPKSRGQQYNLKQHESNWHRYVTVILVILAAALAAMFLVFGNRGRRRWFVMGTNGAFNHRRMFDDNGTNIEISNPMFDEDDSVTLNNCTFSIDLNERTTNFSNPLYERQVLLMNDKHVTPS